MRLETLHLEFFGHFSDKKFEFGQSSAEQSDFHVIYGPNEAGKTTFMEGYLRLLYGFLTSEPYDFVHQRKNLRVSANLDIDGESKLFVRVPTRTGSLQDGNGKPLSDTALQGPLGGLSMQDYRNLLCIDDETIEKGGEEIINSKGDIGTLLFSAAAGISDLSTILGQVREHADSLFRKNSTKTRLAVLKSQLKELDARINIQDLTAAQYKQLKANLKSADIEKDQIKVERLALYAEQNQLQKQLEALPLLKEFDELDIQVSQFRHYPEHLDIDTDQLMLLNKAEVEAASEIKRRTEDIDSYRAGLAQINLDENQLSIADALEQLLPLYSSYATARLGLDTERRKQADALQNMAISAREFADDGIDPVKLLVTPSSINELDACLKNKARASEALQSAKRSLEKIENNVVEKRLSMAALHPPDEATRQVSQVLEKFNGQVFLAEAKAAEKRGADAENEVRRSLDKLAHKGQSFTCAPVCSLLSEEADELARELDSVNKDIDTVVSDVNENAESIRLSHAQIDNIQALEGITSDEQAIALKQERDAAWQAHRQDYLPHSADVFEATLHRHDQGMEGRIANASKLGELRQLQRLLVEQQARQASLQQQEASLKARGDVIQTTLADCVASAGLTESIAPALVKNWIAHCENAAAQERNLERINAELAPIFEKATRLHNALSEHIERDQAALPELIDAATEMDSYYRLTQKQIADEQASLSRLEAELQQQSKQVDELDASLAEKQRAWQELVARSFPVKVDPEKLEPVLNTLHSMRELDKDRVTALQQVQSMEAAIDQFSAELASLSGKMNVPMEDDITQTYEALKTLAQATRVAHRRQTQLQELISSSEEALALANVKLDASRVQRNQLAAHFDTTIATSTINELLAAERIARETIQARKRHSELKKQLMHALDAESPDDVRDQLAGLDAAGLEVRLLEVGADIKAVDDRYEEAMQKLGSCKRSLDAIVGDASVAELEQQRATVELEMSDVALEYIKLSLGHKLAERAILQYREKYRGSMMQETESVFVELTNGAYSRLQTSTDGSTETLQVVQANGTAKSVHEPAKSRRKDSARAPSSDLSKGTRFQLYLALRAAAYQQLASDGTALPFICDDIFETFDEGRTRAACCVLQRIGKTGQAVYLTHHQHVVDIAREVCGDQVRIHDL